MSRPPNSRRRSDAQPEPKSPDAKPRAKAVHDTAAGSSVKAAAPVRDEVSDEVSEEVSEEKRTQAAPPEKRAAAPAAPQAPRAQSAKPAAPPAEQAPAPAPALTSAPASAPEPTPAPASTPAPAPASASAPSPTPAPEPTLPREVLAADHDVAAVLGRSHRDPFAFFGMHQIGVGGPVVVRAFLPGAAAVAVVDAATGKATASLEKIHGDGLFAGVVAGRKARFAYRLRATFEAGESDIEDPYRFPPVLPEADAHLLAEGSHLRAYAWLGAHPATVDGVKGVAFAVWAPHAARVAVIGEFNNWDGRRHAMRLRHECGVWEIFLPGIRPGQLYKYEIKSPSGARLTDKCDPFAFHVEKSPGSASIVHDPDQYRWGDAAWTRARERLDVDQAPISIYEVHLPSWRRKPEEGHRCLNYRELARELVDYVSDLGFTHIELLPIAEFDFDGSLGYQPFALFAPTSRWGDPDDFKLLVDHCHRAGIGVIADWVPFHFSDDPHGLRLFDGTHLYEHPDPRQRRHPGWNTLIYDYGRREVSTFLVSNALFWLDRYHLDALRVPAVSSMLYLDYGRARGEWTPNRHGGHENLDAIDVLRRINDATRANQPGAFTIAEATSAWPAVSQPTPLGGLGFGYKWNSNWVRDILRYVSRNPVHRKYYHEELIRGPQTAFDENHILPLSHEEVSPGRGSLLRRMPGDRWQRFANLRLLYAVLYSHPGKKLLFMGNEFAPDREWNPEISLDWHLLDDPMHRGIQNLVRDLNALYRGVPALHQLDCEPAGFEWIDANDTEQSIVSFMRKDAGGGFTVVVYNFTPVVRDGYRVGVPEAGFYAESLNTDAEKYGGSNAGNFGGVNADEWAIHGRPFSLSLRLPPFAAVILTYMSRRLAAEEGADEGRPAAEPSGAPAS